MFNFGCFLILILVISRWTARSTGFLCCTGWFNIPRSAIVDAEEFDLSDLVNVVCKNARLVRPAKARLIR